MSLAACGADLVVVGGVDADELVGFIVAGLRLKRDGKLGAPSQAGYEAVLREACPRSPFWEVGAKLRREGKPAPEHE
jgi:hypothetical protein